MTKHNRVSGQHHDSVKEHAKALVAATKHIADEKVAEARTRLSGILESASEMVEDLEERAMDKAKQADHYVRENPYQVAAVALGLGALIGFFWARRK
jgi:ElaB/YqjD/DUF883 family membrane-anchored ribosome-binding protein